MEHPRTTKLFLYAVLIISKNLDLSEKHYTFATEIVLLTNNMEFDITEIDDLSGPKAHVYSVILEGEDTTLLEQFFKENIEYKSDVKKIINKIKTMANDTGCRKQFFKEGEGAWGDGVVALRGTGLLRLYGIYFHDAVVLFGSGGYKPPGVRAYEDHPPLNAKAQQMRDIAKTIYRMVIDREMKIDKDGTIILL